MVKGAAFLVAEVIPFVVRHQVHDGPFGQGCGLVEHEAPILDVRSNTAHLRTLRVSPLCGKRAYRAVLSVTERRIVAP